MVEIKEEEVQTALKMMKEGLVPGIHEVCIEMTVAAGEVGVRWTKKLMNGCKREGSSPENWSTGLIVLIWKEEG